MLSLDKAVILPVDTNDLDLYWDFVSEYIESALEHTDGEVPLNQVKSDIANHDRQLWVIKYNNKYIASIVTRIYEYESGLKIGEISIAGGQRHDLWDHFPDVVGEWFKSYNCNHMDIIGRKGWERLYKKRGFRLAYTQLRKKL